MLVNESVDSLFKNCTPDSVSLSGLEVAIAAVASASNANQHATVINNLVEKVDGNLGTASSEELKGSMADRMKQCFCWSLFVVESLLPGFTAQHELTILLGVRLLQRRCLISRLPVDLQLPTIRDLQLDYVKICTSPTCSSDGIVQPSADVKAIDAAYKLPEPRQFVPDNDDLPYALWKRDMKSQISAMRLSGLTALHYLLRGTTESIRRELYDVVSSTECYSVDPNFVMNKVFAKLDGRFATSWTVPEALERWQSLEQGSSETMPSFLAKFDSERSLYEGVTGRKLEDVDLIARLLGAVKPRLALKLQESHGSRVRSLSLDELKSDLIFFERLLKKSDAAATGSKSPGPTENDEKKSLPKGRCYRCFKSGHNADSCPAHSVADAAERCGKCGNYHPSPICSMGIDDLLCGYCHNRGHRASVCTAPRKPQPQTTLQYVTTSTPLFTPVSLPAG